jgi:putative FmdB family regulatory protein
MPVYEFECTACGRQFEDLVSLSAVFTGIECPSCGRKKARKLLSLFATSTRSDGNGASAASSGPSSSCTTCSTHACSTCR